MSGMLSENGTKYNFSLVFVCPKAGQAFHFFYEKETETKKPAHVVLSIYMLIMRIIHLSFERCCFVRMRHRRNINLLRLCSLYNHRVEIRGEVCVLFRECNLKCVS